MWAANQCLSDVSEALPGDSKQASITEYSSVSRCYNKIIHVQEVVGFMMFSGIKTTVVIRPQVFCSIIFTSPNKTFFITMLVFIVDFSQPIACTQDLIKT